MANYRSCPACQRSMFITQFEDHEVDQCPACAGIWFDHAEIYADYQNPAFPETTRHCPCCQTALLEADLLDGHKIKVDICPNHHGAFVDYDELEHVRHSEQIQSAIAEVSKKISVKTWFFQFFTQMPVEYNIKPRSRPVVTQALIAINALIFLLQFGANLPVSQFLAWGFVPDGLDNPYRLHTLITSQFLHGSWMHLLGNLYFLYIIGDNIEDVLGKGRFLLTYLSLGILGCLSHWLLNQHSTTPMVGASGAISGLFGMYLVLFRRAMLTQMFVVFQIKLPVWGYFLIWFGLNLFGQLLGNSGVAYMAHIGGFIAGIAFASIAYESLRKHYPLLDCLNSDFFTARHRKPKVKG